MSMHGMAGHAPGPGQTGKAGRYAVLSLGIPLVPTEDGTSPRFELQLLERAPEHASNVAQILQEFRYEQHLHPVTNGPVDHAELVERAVVRDDIDVLIVHIVGHGELAEDRSEKLYVLDSDGERLSQPVTAWINRIEDHPGRHRPVTLFILDVCYAGEVAVTSWHARMDVAKRRAWVLAASGPKDKAFGYRLSRAVVHVLQKYRDREIRFDPSVQYIPQSTVYQEIERTVNDLIVEDKGLPQSIITSLVPGHADLSHLPFFPNPSFGQPQNDGLSAKLPPEIAKLADWAWDPEHFMRRGGGAEPVGRDWRGGYFSGREEELQELSSWFDDETAAPGLRVVTGKPGAGKSALIGVLVCAAHPALRPHTTSLWHKLGRAAPGMNDRVAVIHARRLGLDQITTSLAHQLRVICGTNSGSEASQSETSPASPADHLLSLLPEHGRPVTVIVDALDEAVRPDDISSALLVPLAEKAQAHGSRLRLLIGTREDSRFRQLLTLARSQNACTDLSSASPESVCKGLITYVELLLTADGPYAHGSRRLAREALATAIAERLTGLDGQGGPAEQTEDLQCGEFLAAGLYVHYLLAATRPCDTPKRQPNWAAESLAACPNSWNSTSGGTPNCPIYAPC